MVLDISFHDIKSDYYEATSKSFRRNVNCGFCTTLLGVLVICILNSFAKVSSTEYGLAINTRWPELHDEVLEPGLHMIPLFGDIILWPSIYETIAFEAKNDLNSIHCNSRDGLQIVIDASFQFKAAKHALYELTLEYATYEEYKRFVIFKSASLLVESCSLFTAQNFQHNRSVVAFTMESTVKTGLQALNAEVSDLQLENVARPVAYEKSVEEKESARTDIILAENERSQQIRQAETRRTTRIQEAEAFAETKTKEATTRATTRIQSAETDSIKRLAEAESAAKKSLQDALTRKTTNKASAQIKFQEDIAAAELRRITKTKEAEIKFHVDMKHAELDLRKAREESKLFSTIAQKEAESTAARAAATSKAVLSDYKAKGNAYAASKKKFELTTTQTLNLISNKALEHAKLGTDLPSKINFNQ